MRKLIFSFIAFLAIVFISFSSFGCTEKKSVSNDSVEVDSIIEPDTMEDSVDNIIAQSPMPKAADELFDDFIFNFAANRKLQFKRIQFPLPVCRDGKVSSKMGKKQWKMDYFFMKQEYYTLIFDSRKQMGIVKDTSVNHVELQKVVFQDDVIKQYNFDRVNGQFMLTSIGFQPIEQNVNGSFLKFYHRFANDEQYQIESLDDLVTFTAPDPDDDFSSITGSITPQQWPSFKPFLIPDGNIFNIIYGQKYEKNHTKVFIVRGIATDLEISMIFQKKKGQWILTKFNN